MGGVLSSILIALVFLSMIAMGLGNFALDFGYRNTTDTTVRLIDQAPDNIQGNITQMQVVFNQTESITNSTSAMSKEIKDLASIPIVGAVVAGIYFVIIATVNIFALALNSVNLFVGSILPLGFELMGLPSWFSGGVIAIIMIVVVFGTISALLGRRV